jgi:hypothetical protein
MKTRHQQIGLPAVAILAMACADATSPVARTLVLNSASPQITNTIGYPFVGIADGDVVVCNSANVPGTMSFSVSVNGGPPSTVNVAVNAQTGSTACTTVFTSQVLNAFAPERVVVSELSPPANWALASINTIRYLDPVLYNNGPAPGLYTAPRLDDLESLASGSADLRINHDMAKRVTFTNTFTPDLCDFITFGRLVRETAGGKVVISGNAGGNNADGSIKNEFHVEANGVDHHVADAISYGPIALGPLSALANSRIVTGTAKNGVAVELRVWDGGEPGKNDDRVYVKLNGVELLGANGQFVDQGNMQHHLNCRGPG